MKKPFYFFALLLSLSALAGCSLSEDKDVTPMDKDKNTTQNEDKNTKDVDNDDSDKDSLTTDSDNLTQADQKLIGYVDCINGFSSQILSAYDRYLSWADETTGPTGNESNINGISKLYTDPKACLEGITKAKNLKPVYAELDKAGEAYAVALKNVEPLMTEANEYYEEKNYEDDAMAKGKELHPKLVEAFKAFDAADINLRAELEKIQDDLDIKRLAQLEKTEGKKYAYLSTNTMVLAKKVLNQANVADIKDIKLEELQKAVENFEKSVDDLKAYDKTHESELALGVSVDSFISDAGSLVTAGKELMRRVRDNKEYDMGEAMLINTGTDWLVEGTPGKVLHAYNDLVNESNSLRF